MDDFEEDLSLGEILEKQSLRRQINMHVNHFLKSGGKITHIPAGKQNDKPRTRSQLNEICFRRQKEIGRAAF